MEADLKKMPGIGHRTYSMQAFIKQIVATLTASVAVSSAVVVLLIYLPLKAEPEKSLIDNFDRLSFISYASLQNSIDCGFEGARTLSVKNP